MSNKILFLFFLCSFSLKMIGQEEQEFKKIANSFYQSLDSNNLKRGNYYATSYLNKARKSKKQYLLNGYYYKALATDSEKKINYLDSVINLSKESIDYKDFPEYAYFEKANTYYIGYDFKKATNNYLLTIKFAKEKNDEYLTALCKVNLALIKAEKLGKEKEALSLLKESLEFYNDLDLSNYTEDYSLLLFAIAENYRKLHQNDSCGLYINKGLEFTKKYKLNLYRQYFIYNKGINFYNKGFPKSAIKNLKTSYRDLDIDNKMVANYYLAKSYQEIGDNYNKIFHLEKLDSIQKGRNIYFPELRQGLEDIVGIYKAEGKLEKAIQKIDRIIQLDSINLDNYKYIINNLPNKFDHDKLISEKSFLLNNTTVKNQDSNNYWLYILSLCFLDLIVYLSIKRKRNERLEVSESKLESNVTVSTPIIIEKRQLSQPKDLPSEIIESVLEKLDLFEKRKGFLSKNITTRQLSKLTDTNDKYLSKIINSYKRKTIPNYINDLRISYILNKLKTETRFKFYTINAIAEEGGFSNTKSFNQAFQKTTNTRAIDYIKRLKNQAKSKQCI